MSSPLIRPYMPTSSTPDESDIAAVTRIYGHHVRYGRASFETEPPSIEDMHARFSTLLDAQYPILVAEDTATKTIVGYAYAGPHKARRAYNQTVEDSIYVAPELHQQGIGTLLLSRLLIEAQTRSYAQMMAVIGNSEPASVALHAKLGFTMIGTARGIGYKFGEYIDVTYMQRAVAQPI